MNSHEVDDLQKLGEVYSSSTLLQEGLLDRLRARKAGLQGSLSGLKQRAGAAYQGAKSVLSGDAQGAQQAAQQAQLAKNSGEKAKIESYKKLAEQKLNTLAYEIFIDLQKLGINLQGVSPQSINVFKAQLLKSFDKLLDSLSNPVTPEEVETDEELEAVMDDEETVEDSYKPLDYVLQSVTTSVPLIVENKQYILSQFKQQYKSIFKKFPKDNELKYVKEKVENAFK